MVHQLHLIRNIDKQVLILQNQIDPKRELALSKITQYELKKNSKLKSEIEELLKEINQIHKKMLNLSKEKMEISEKVYNCIDEPTEDLDNYLSNNPAVQETTTGPGRKHFKSKRGKKENGNHKFILDWEEDLVEPLYCYCRRPSFGIMVMCDNTFCETEWFHTECLEEKNPG